MAHSEAHSQSGSQSGEELAKTTIDYKSICMKFMECFTLRDPLEYLSDRFSLKHTFEVILTSFTQSEKQVTNNSDPIMDKHCSRPTQIIISGSNKWLVGGTTENIKVLTKTRKINSHPSQKPMITMPRSQIVWPLSDGSVVSSTCDHNKGIISSAKDNIKVIRTTSDFSEMLPSRYLEAKSNIISGSYDYNGGALTSKE